MNDTQKLLQLLTDVDNIDTFVRTSYADNEISKRVAEELLRLLREASFRALKQ